MALDLEALNAAIVSAAKETFKVMCKITLDEEPAVNVKPIELLEKGKMAASAYSKVYVSSYISYVHFFSNADDMKKNKPCGVIVIYVKDSGVINLLPALGYQTNDYTDRVLVKNMVGELCNNIAGGLKNGLMGSGYRDLQISSPFNYRDTIADGVVVPKGIKEVHEVGVNLWGATPVVIDVALDV